MTQILKVISCYLLDRVKRRFHLCIKSLLDTMYDWTELSDYLGLNVITDDHVLDFVQ